MSLTLVMISGGCSTPTISMIYSHFFFTNAPKAKVKYKLEGRLQTPSAIQNSQNNTGKRKRKEK